MTQVPNELVTGLGSAALLTAGTGANNAVQLDGTGKLPAVDGSQLTGVVKNPMTADLDTSTFNITFPTGANIGTLTSTSLTAARSWTLPNSSGSLTTASSISTFTNKTIDATTNTLLGVAETASANTFTKAQRVTPVVLTDAATIAIDTSLSNNFSVTLAGNRTLGLPTNLVAGQDGHIHIKQDATGTRTLAYNAAYKFAGGTAPTLTTTANAVDRLDYYVVSATEIHASLAGDVK